MCKVRVKGKFYNMTLSVYAPTEESNGDEIEQFYSDLSNICDKVQKHDALILLGDFNARIGKKLANHGVAGNTLHDQTSNNGERLIQLAQTQNLEISSTKFPHKEIHKGTWKIPGEQCSNQIDHVLINKRRASSVMDVKTYRSPNCDSDHYLKRVEIRQQINVTNEGRCKKPIIWDVNKLREPQIRRQHEQEINNKIDEVELSSDIELKWDNIKNINDTANQVIGNKINQGNASWYDEECKEAIKTKNEARSRCLARETRANRDVYEQKRKFARKICRQKKQNDKQRNRSLANRD
jgi:hypothetical protein